MSLSAANGLRIALGLERRDNHIGEPLDVVRRERNARGSKSPKERPGATAIAVGGANSCAVVSGGKVRCWGWNGVGQLGDGTFNNRLTPVAVKNLHGATAIAAGRHHTCAVVSGGETRCWGHNYISGVLGVESGSRNGIINHPIPVTVESLVGATAVAARGVHTCAAVSGGEMRCWGWNEFSQLGNPGGSVDPWIPLPPLNVHGVIAMTAGGDHTCAVVGNGEARCWGWNDFGQVGNGTTETQNTAVPVSDIADATAIVTGSDHSCAVVGNGEVYCWGLNNYGQLGNGATDNHSTPVVVGGLDGVTAIAAGWDHTCAAVSDGTVRCWGRNDHGQLGRSGTGSQTEQ
jgi:alpha-tubulin suppressor-like RCC1 family protein